jgi:hypothetical protein
MPTVLVAAPLLVAAAGALAQPEPQNTIKGDRPPIGSMVRKDMVTGAIAVNQSYDQLSARDKAKFNENYEHVAEGDEPPFPLKGLREILDPIRKAQAKLLVSGELSLVADVDPTGKVTSVSVFKSPDPDITKFAGQVILLTKFKPAVCAGLPCQMAFPLNMVFRVEL